MEYATAYDVGDRKRNSGINEDSVAITVFDGDDHPGVRGRDRSRLGDEDGDPPAESAGPEAIEDAVAATAERLSVPRVDAPAAGDTQARAGDGSDADEMVDDGVDANGPADADESDEEAADDGAADADEAADDEAADDGAADADEAADDEAAKDGGAGAQPPQSAAVFALADGAGGHDAGDVASALATTVVCEELATTAVRAAAGDPQDYGVDLESAAAGLSPASIRAAVAEAIVAAHRRILEYAGETAETPYTTIVAGVYANGALHYGWVGDSRAYVVNRERETIEQLTRDHAVVTDLADAGDIDEVEAMVHPRGNEITRALGGPGRGDPSEATVQVETDSVSLYAEDVVLVTSDGLVDAQTDARSLYERYVQSDRDPEVAEAVRQAVVTDAELRDRILAGDSLAAIADDFVGVANDRGGKDNLSTLLVRDPALEPTPTAPEAQVRDLAGEGPVEDRQTILVED
jgi:serine/threonine protein phosphatase PrpC